MRRARVNQHADRRRLCRARSCPCRCPWPRPCRGARRQGGALVRFPLGGGGLLLRWGSGCRRLLVAATTRGRRLRGVAWRGVVWKGVHAARSCRANAPLEWQGPGGGRGAGGAALRRLARVARIARIARHVRVTVHHQHEPTGPSLAPPLAPASALARDRDRGGGGPAGAFHRRLGRLSRETLRPRVASHQHDRAPRRPRCHPPRWRRRRRRRPRLGRRRGSTAVAIAIAAATPASRVKVTTIDPEPTPRPPSPRRERRRAKAQVVRDVLRDVPHKLLRHRPRHQPERPSESSQAAAAAAGVGLGLGLGQHGAAAAAAAAAATLPRDRPTALTALTLARRSVLVAPDGARARPAAGGRCVEQRLYRLVLLLVLDLDLDLVLVEHRLPRSEHRLPNFLPDADHDGMRVRVRGCCRATMAMNAAVALPPILHVILRVILPIIRTRPRVSQQHIGSRRQGARRESEDT